MLKCVDGRGKQDMVILKSKLYLFFRELLSKFISVKEVWLDEEPEEVHDVDVLHYFQWTNPIRGIQCNEFHSILLDLTKDQDEIWKSIKKNTRYEIRRAEKDQLVYKFWETSTSDIINEFSNFYEEFALQKGLPMIPRPRLRNLMDAGKLDISRIKTKDGASLVWHAYYRSKTYSCLLYSASLFRSSTNTSYRNMLGRANRYHHWQDIVRFKNLGISIYDFGGWYGGNKDQEKLGINKFKEEFGEEVITKFNCVHGITMKGKLYLQLRGILTKDD
jgi:hypothetical protein